MSPGTLPPWAAGLVTQINGVTAVVSTIAGIVQTISAYSEHVTPAQQEELALQLDALNDATIALHAQTEAWLKEHP